MVRSRRLGFGKVWCGLAVKVCVGKVMCGEVVRGMAMHGGQGGARYLWLGDVRSGMVSYGKAVKFRSGM